MKKIGEIKNLQDERRFAELTALVFTCLSLSHGNADPERGFSFNKAILEHRETLGEATIIALRMVKDAILQFGSVEEFPMPRRLLDLCAASRKKYFLHLEIEKENRQQLLTAQRKDKAALEARDKKKANCEKISELENEIKEEVMKLSVAMKLIADGNQSLSDLTTGKGRSVDKELVMKAQMMLNAGVKKSTTITKKIDELRNEIKKLAS